MDENCLTSWSLMKASRSRAAMQMLGQPAAMPPPARPGSCRASELGPASVYNAFSDKRTLFTQCLDRYLDANMRARMPVV